MIIGISGVARSGKDTLANGFVEIFKQFGIKAKRYALADALKHECRNFLKKNIGINPFTTNDEEKKIIRPFLVFYGTEMRRKLDEDCWIKALEKLRNDGEIMIVSDIRYENEAKWIKDNGGLLIHISRTLNSGETVPPANEQEKINDPIVAGLSDPCFVWQTFGDLDKNLMTDFCYAFFQACFGMEEIQKWQTTYPLSKRLNKTKTKTV